MDIRGNLFCIWNDNVIQESVTKIRIAVIRRREGRYLTWRNVCSYVSDSSVVVD